MILMDTKILFFHMHTLTLTIFYYYNSKNYYSYTGFFHESHTESRWLKIDKKRTLHIYAPSNYPLKPTVHR